MARFSEVKAILDGLVAGRDLVRMRQKHGGDQFSWQSACALRAAVVILPDGQFPLIDPLLIGNGRSNETYIVRILSGPLDDEGLPQMPLRGPYASGPQIQKIRDWIDAGAKDDEPGPAHI